MFLMIAVVDRIEGDMAVLLVGPSELKVNFPVSLLPPIHEGAVLKLNIEVDENEEQQRRQQAQSLIDKLLAKNKHPH